MSTTIEERRVAQARRQAQEYFDLAEGLEVTDPPPVTIRFSDALVTVASDGTTTYTPWRD